MKLLRSKYFKYIIVTLVFGIWLSFFDDYSWSKQKEMNKQLNSLQKELQNIKNEINKRTIETKMIKNNIEFIEKTGRNNYYMKGKEEDLFIFLKKDETTGELVSFED
jgi:cell division protein FtsB